MRHLSIPASLPVLFALLAVSLAAVPAAAEPAVPAAGTAERALLDGLKLVRDGNFDGWITQWCSTAELCYTDKSVQSLKKYNLPTAQRFAAQCIKGAGDALEVTRTVVNGKETKVFVECDPQSQPKPFTLVKEAKGWRFKTM